MSRPKGTPKNGGRKAGTPNKLTANVEAMILAALDEAGGKAYLLRQAHENPTAFMRLLSKVLAHQISGEPDEPIEIWETISFEEHRRQAREAIAAAFAEPKREAETDATRLPEPQGEAVAPRDFAREGDSAPAVARVPARYRRPRAVGAWSS